MVTNLIQLDVDQQLLVRACKSSKHSGIDLVNRLRKIYSLRRLCDPEPAVDPYLIELLVNAIGEHLNVVEMVLHAGSPHLSTDPLSHNERCILSIASQLRFSEVKIWEEYRAPAIFRNAG